MGFQEVNCDRSAKTIEIRLNRLTACLFSGEGELLSKWGEVTPSDQKAMLEEVAKDKAAMEKYKRDSRDNDI
jgi:predicted NBD/HSP70 family sugar kinase